MQNRSSIAKNLISWTALTTVPSRQNRGTFSGIPWLAYLELIKFRYHFNYLGVVFGVLIFAKELQFSHVITLAWLYLSFNVLLYGGIYTLNDIADLPSDQAHPRKRFRPVAAGIILPGSARAFSFTMIVLGILTGALLFGTSIVIAYLLFLSINLFYSLRGRNVPFLELVINSATHPLRFLMGAHLVGAGLPWLHLFAYFFLAFAVVCLRRLVEMDVLGWEARSTLSRYPRHSLNALTIGSLAAILLLFALDGFTSWGFYTIVISTYLVIILGASYCCAARKGLRRMWTH
jgi:4-hydroxybenzoate polyprenyltransferase